jgi:parallel beta-helix repeat protein
MESKRILPKVFALVFGALLVSSMLSIAHSSGEPIEPPSGMVSWWPGDGNAWDIVGPNDGVLMNGATFGDGMVGPAFLFDGVNAFVATPSTNISGLQRLTIDMWVKLNSMPAGRIERFVTISPGVESAVIRYDGINGPGQLHFYMNISDVFHDIRVNNVLQSGAFHHVAGTYDGSFMRLYFDGVQVGFLNVDGTVNYGSGVTISTTHPECLNGLIDEVEIFNRALNSSEIQAIYAAGSAGKLKHLSTKFPWPMFRGDLEHSGYTESPGPVTNQLLWNFSGCGEIDSSPAVTNGRVYFGSADHQIYCLDATTGIEIWNYTTGSLVLSSPAVAYGKVYVGSDDGAMYCLDALTGIQVWNYTTLGGITSSPAVTEGEVYFGSADGHVYCLSAYTGAHIWDYGTGADTITMSSPAVALGKVYVGTDGGFLYCLDALTGNFTWRYWVPSNATASIDSSPSVVNGKVYFGSDNMRVYCLDALNGTQIWNYPTLDAVWSSPAVAYGKVYVGSDDKNLYCLDALTGAQVWNHTTGAYVAWSSPAIADGKVYFGDYDAQVRCLDASTGTPIWSYTAAGAIPTSPAVADNMLFIGGGGGGDHTLYAFGSVIRVPKDYSSIQQAINAAAPGDTVWVDPGVYHESIIINKTVTLLGKIGSPPPVFQGGGSGTAINITAAGSGSTVADFAISNWAQGILLNDASTCKVYDNIMSQMSTGGLVVQGGASQNSIYGNIITQSAVGINVTGSNNNAIFNNNFIGNIVQLSISASTGTVLDNGFSAGGNFWSDYKQKYPTAQEIDASGIWNTAYAIDANNKDHYPLKIPYGYKNNPIPGDVNGDAKVDMGDIVALCDAFGSKPGKPNWNANCDLDKDGKITMGDIVIGLDHFGQHYP